MINITVDLMGADNGPEKLIGGAIKAINENPNLMVSLCGPEALLNTLLKEYTYNENQLVIIDSSEVITNMDIPTRAFKTKPDSSLVKGLSYAKDNSNGFVSCGSTGAVLVSSQFILGKLSEYRPCLACVLSTADNKPVIIADCGANIDCKPEMLLGFAKMAVSYMKAIGIENPRVSLLSNGAEEKKGNELVKETHALFKNENFNFIGNIEGKEALSGNTDCIICDGFAGNIVLKTIEGAAKTVFTDIIKMAKSATNKAEADILKNTVLTLMNKYDYNSKGGAVLLGVNNVVVKGHGAATAETIYSIIMQAYMVASNNLIDNTKQNLS